MLDRNQNNVGRYIGTRSELKGCIASLVNDGERLFAQFTEVNGGRPPAQITQKLQGAEKYLFNWHPFPKTDFEVLS